MPEKPVPWPRLITMTFLIRVQDRHAVNRAGRIVARSRVDDVIRSDDQRNISSRKLRIYLVFIVNDVVGHADYCRTAFDAG